MEHLVPLLSDVGFVAYLVFARLFGIATMLPSMGGRQINLAIRTVMSVCLTMLIAPACSAWVSPASLQALSIPALFIVITKEFGIGLILGGGLQVLLLGVQIAGQLIGQMSGLSLAGVYDAGSGQVANPISKLLDLLAMGVFLLIGGHRIVLAALLNTFQDWPPGMAEIGTTASDAAADLLTRSFLLGAQAALPVMATLFVSNLLAGMLGRLMPQMNVLLVSTGMNSLLLMAAMFIGIGTMAWTLQEHLDPLVGAVVRLCGN